jgi:two-component system LytT family response regulator
VACQQLDADYFIRIHKGHVVNIKEVVQYRRGRGGQVLLSNGVLIDVAFRRKGQFMERYQRPI